MMYRFMHGNNLGTLVFVWNVPKEGGEATANAKLVSELNSRQKVYSTREMCRLYIQRYMRLSSSTRKSSKAVLRNLYRSLTGDIASAQSSAEKEVDGRVSALAKEVFELDKPEILLDMRRLNGKPNSTVFERFWGELSFYLEGITPACDDRRHGSTLH